MEAVVAELHRSSGAALRVDRLPDVFTRPPGRFDDHRRAERFLDALAAEDDAADLCLLAGAGAEPRLVADRWQRALLARPRATTVQITAHVTVVDVDAFEDDFAGAVSLRERGWVTDASDGRLVPDMLAEQIEFADLVLLSSARECSPDGSAGYVARVVRALQPGVRTVRAAHGQVAPAALGDVVRAETDEAGRDRDAAWARAWAGDECCSDEGCRFVYAARAPFHPTRLAECLLEGWPGALRLKGRVWVASRPVEALALSRAGGALRVFQVGRWWSTVPVERWPRDAAWRASLHETWDPRFGDRHQRIAVVGLGVDRAAVTRSLDACLLTERELAAGPAEWVAWAEPVSAEAGPLRSALRDDGQHEGGRP